MNTSRLTREIGSFALIGLVSTLAYVLLYALPRLGAWVTANGSVVEAVGSGALYDLAGA